MSSNIDISHEMYNLAKQLFPICRSITGDGVRETLAILKNVNDNLNIIEVPSGVKVFDWTIPKEWIIRDAYIIDPQGNKILDFNANNLHIMSYSGPINKEIELEELQNHLYSIEDNPHAIPYVTSYYKENWGFCLSHQQRSQLKTGRYKVFIDSEFINGSLSYGEILIEGDTEKEIFLSTNICHPSLANNELSGPIVTIFLSRWIQNISRKYSYRIIFIPETIGALAYLSSHLSIMQEKIIAGYCLTCVGDERQFSYLESRMGNTLADKAAKNILETLHPEYKLYRYLDRGSDERQYCAPGIDLPIGSVMRSKYATYPEYHTSLDNLNLISAKGLMDSFSTYMSIIKLLEKNEKYKVTCLGEPQLGKRGLYPNINTPRTHQHVVEILNFIAYADGKHDLIDISNLIGVSVFELYDYIDKLTAYGLLEICK